MNITSINNDTVKYWCSLKEKKYRDKYKKFIVEGDHLVDIALSKNLVDTIIYLDSEKKGDSDNVFVSESVMKKISSQQSISKVAAIVNIVDSNISDANAVILDNLQDPGNLGTIIRSAVAFGFENIFLGQGTVDVYNEKTIRASEGMIFLVNLKKLDLVNDIEYIKNFGYTLLGTDVVSGESIKKYKDKKVAIIIGNEGRGMNKSIECDKYIKIGMSPMCESLNAGVSASILMSEVFNG